jgi:hypothetical protein
MDLVFEFSNSLSSEMCKKIHDKFNGDFRVKTFPSEDFLKITHLFEWEDIYNELYKKMPEFIEMFLKHKATKFPYAYPYTINMTTDSFFVQRKKTVDVWECPWNIENNLERCVAFFVYLTDEGETDFIHKKIKSRTGKLVMFPATWHDVYKHTECTILSGFLYRPLINCRK